MKKNTIIDMKSSQFPFGQVQEEDLQNKKILIKKRIFYKSEKQHAILEQKIDILKNIYHKNTINFREVQDNHDGTIDVYYNYVPFALENFFEQCDADTIKEVHKQLIQLAIHLAKNFLLTSFNPNRCGVILNADKKWQIKYYLPLNEIVITDNTSMLQRSVQLFTVQSLHFLDTINEGPQSMQNSFQRNYKRGDSKYRESIEHRKKNRRQSQPYFQSGKKQRRFSNQPAFLQFSKRKFSNISRQKSQFSTDSYKQTNASTLFQTLRSSSPTAQDLKKCNSTLLSMAKKNYCDQVIQKAKRANSRSRKALLKFNSIIQSLRIYKGIIISLKKQQK